MPAFKRPGVYVQEVPAATSVNGSVNADAVAAFVGVASRGPLTPVLVRSWSEYVKKFGDFTYGTYLPYTVFQFFANGGSQCYVVRVADAASAVLATRTLSDNAGSPQNTLRVDAINPGVWGNSIFIDIVATVTGRFDLVVKFGGVASGNVVERFGDVSMDPNDPRYVVPLVNDASNYVQLTDLHSSTAAPANIPLAQQGTALASGADGNAYSAGNVDTAVRSYATIDAPLVMNLAGITDSTQVSGAIVWAESTGRVFVVADLPVGLTAAGAVTAASAITSSSYGACYYPWLQINDPTKAGTVTKLVPPGGAVVGLYIKSDAQRGPFQTPAGINARVAGAFAVNRALTDDDLDTLNSAVPPVNVIRPVNGYGICVMGGRTLKTGTVDKYIATRRSLIYIKKTLRDLTAPALFEPNDAVLWRALTSTCERFLRQYHAQGGLRGASEDAAFFVKCDGETNDTSAIQNGEVHVEVGVALQYPAEFVVISVGQYEGGSTATES